ncbi:MAG TPA: heavy metal sensor histidine kinase [Burkholderiaceae bacterium]|nr:heavy metal sensor histidine kinase [Burkholderiaceae bacterium]
MTAGPSIRRRLGISFAALALLLFGAMAAFEYLAFDDELERIRTQEIEGTAAVVLHLIDDTRAEGDLEVLRHRLDDVRLGHPAIRVWLQGPGDEIVYGDPPLPAPVTGPAGGSTVPGSSPATSGSNPATSGSNLASGSNPAASGSVLATPGSDPVVPASKPVTPDSTPATIPLRSTDGRITRGTIRPVAAAPTDPIRRMVLTIADDDQQRLRQSLARSLALALVAGTTLATLLGMWLSRRALRPLQAISAQANALSAASPGVRLPEEGIDAEVRDLVASFNRALDRLEAALRQQEAFSADVAHELNTPLATLIAGNEVALATGADPAALREQLADNLDELHRLEAIVADMLFLARADRGEVARRFPATSFAGIVHDVIDYHEAAIADARLTVRVEGDCVAQVDVPLIKRAVSNLLSNATRFARPGSTVQVDIEAHDDEIRWSVTNHGDAIPEQQLPRLFDRFFRAEQSRSRSDQHHGLGLAIVSAIARMHGGRPFARSRNGVTTIGLVLRDRLDPPAPDRVSLPGRSSDA